MKGGYDPAAPSGEKSEKSEKASARERRLAAKARELCASAEVRAVATIDGDHFVLVKKKDWVEVMSALAALASTLPSP